MPKTDNISLNLKNSLTAEQTIKIGNTGQVGLNKNMNAKTRYQWELSNDPLTNLTEVTIQARPIANPSFQSYTANVIDPTVEGIAAALNTLAFGYFYVIGQTKIRTYNDEIVFGDLTTNSNAGTTPITPLPITPTVVTVDDVSAYFYGAGLLYPAVGQAFFNDSFVILSGTGFGAGEANNIIGSLDITANKITALNDYTQITARGQSLGTVIKWEDNVFLCFYTDTSSADELYCRFYSVNAVSGAFTAESSEILLDNTQSFRVFRAVKVGDTAFITTDASSDGGNGYVVQATFSGAYALASSDSASIGVVPTDRDCFYVNNVNGDGFAFYTTGVAPVESFYRSVSESAGSIVLGAETSLLNFSGANTARAAWMDFVPNQDYGFIFASFGGGVNEAEYGVIQKTSPTTLSIASTATDNTVDYIDTWLGACVWVGEDPSDENIQYFVNKAHYNGAVSGSDWAVAIYSIDVSNPAAAPIEVAQELSATLNLYYSDWNNIFTLAPANDSSLNLILAAWDDGGTSYAFFTITIS